MLIDLLTPKEKRLIILFDELSKTPSETPIQRATTLCQCTTQKSTKDIYNMNQTSLNIQS